MKIAIATDSTSGIGAEEAKALGVSVVPMPVTINDQVYLEGAGLDRDFFFRMQAEGAVITSSQLSPGVLTDLWDDLLEHHDAVLYLPMTSGLSSSCATARALSAEYDGRVRVADIKRISVPLWQAVQDALTLREKGLGLEEIASRLEEKALCSSIYITPTTLEY